MLRYVALAKFVHDRTTFSLLTPLVQRNVALPPSRVVHAVIVLLGHPGVVETAQNGNFNNKSVVIAQCEPMGW